ncbi:MAG TPA: hypothetical protein VLA22_06405 [Gaiellaceae bacterium]|nr:hypothetical protein [Gaiellaceae bacterium]
MDKARWDRFAAAGGIVGVALFLVSAVIYGSPSTVGDDASTVAEFFSDNRDAVLWVTFIQGLAVLAFVWFIAALVTTMRDAGEPRLAAAAFASFLLVFAIGALSALARAGLAYSIADEGADLVLPLYHLTLVFDVFTNLIGAGLLAAVCGATFRTGMFPRWWGWITGAAALWAIINSTAWASDGFWSPSGGGAFIGLGVFLAWMLVTSILLTRRAGQTAA